MWPGVVVVEDDVVLLPWSFRFYGSMEAVELGQIDVGVEIILPLTISIRNLPFLLNI